MRTVYVLWHVRPGVHEHGDEEDSKLLGVFSTEESAKAWQKGAIKLPGFRDFPPECFLIAPSELDQPQWRDGFETVMLPD